MSQLAVALASQADDFIILDPKSKTGTAPTEAVRVKAIATISGGYRDKEGKMQRTRDGEIYVHGEAPGLSAILTERGGKSLTVAFPSNNPRDFIHQRFTEYTASALKCFGDDTQITEIMPPKVKDDPSQWVHHPAGTKEYEACLARCKNSISVYFMLAKWEENRPKMIFPDGFGLYRLRCTSLNSLRSILFAVQMMKQTSGFIAGIPFELNLQKEEKVDPRGAKRQVWIWNAISKAPDGYELTASELRGVLEAGRNEVQMLQLEAPQPPSIEQAIHDAKDEIAIADEEIPEAEVEEIHNPAPPANDKGETTLDPKAQCDARDFQKKYFAITKGTYYATEVGRHAFITDYAPNMNGSLSAFLDNATNEIAQGLCDEVQRRIVDEEYQAEIDNYHALVDRAEPLGLKMGSGRPWPRIADDDVAAKKVPLEVLRQQSDLLAQALPPAVADPVADETGGEQTPTPQSDTLFDDEPTIGDQKKTAPTNPEPTPSSTPAADGAPNPDKSASEDSPEDDDSGGAQAPTLHVHRWHNSLMAVIRDPDLGNYDHEGDYGDKKMIEILLANRKSKQLKNVEFTNVLELSEVQCSLFESMVRTEAIAFNDGK